MDHYSLIEIARAEENRQAIGTAEISIDHQYIAGGVICYCGNGWGDVATGLGLAGEVTSAEFETILDFFRARNVNPKFEVSPFVDQSLIELLAEHQFVVEEFENVFFRRITADETFEHLSNEPKGIEFVLIDPLDSQKTDEFIRVATSGFVPENRELEPAEYLASKKMVEHPRCRSIAALDGDKIVGAATCEITSEISCFFGTTVLKSHRRRGIQTSLMVQRIQLAQKAGCPIVTIHSNPGIATERNAIRLGFSLAYTKVVMRPSKLI